MSTVTLPYVGDDIEDLLTYGVTIKDRSDPWATVFEGPEAGLRSMMQEYWTNMEWPGLDKETT